MKCYTFILYFYEYAFTVASLNMVLVNLHLYRNQTLEMFQHGYQSYMKHAYPADELMPISCKGRVRGKTPSRGDLDDALGK